MDVMPCKMSRMPTKALRTNRFAMGFKNEKKPTSANRMPQAVNQPHPRTPNRLSSKEFTNLLMPENSSHMPAMKGKESRVNA